MRTWSLAAIVLLAAASAQATPRPLTAADADAGKPLYLAECSACHGERGDGAGPAAAFLDPRPRNFTRGLFKLRTTPSGQPPATADVLRTIERGMPGSSMPSFSALSPDQRRKIAAHVLQLAGLLDTPEPAPVPTPGSPPPTMSATIARGRELYLKAGCDSCHGETGKGDGEAAERKDDEGHPIRARDFTTGVFRGGGEPVDLYYRIFTGLDGTPMPEYPGDFTRAERFALVDYVRSLRVDRPEPPLPADPLEAGRVVATRHACRACHVLDDGHGGDVGPDLRTTGRIRTADWLRGYLKAPRAYGALDPGRPYRMPPSRLTDRETDALVRYLTAIGASRLEQRPHPSPPPAHVELPVMQPVLLVRPELDRRGHDAESRPQGRARDRLPAMTPVEHTPARQ